MKRKRLNDTHTISKHTFTVLHFVTNLFMYDIAVMICTKYTKCVFASQWGLFSFHHNAGVGEISVNTECFLVEEA